MKESTLRDALLGRVSMERLDAEVRDAVEVESRGRRRVHIEDLPAGETFTITASMLARLCDAVLAHELSASDLEIIGFAAIASDHLEWDEDDQLVGRVLYDWASPEINGELTPAAVRMFREWLMGEVAPPSEPEVTADTLSGSGFLSRTTKVRIERRDANPDRRIVGFHQDAERQWVAELECGHTQHVRHTPPWQVRPWVLTEAGRAAHLGTVLSCRLCADG